MRQARQTTRAALTAACALAVAATAQGCGGGNGNAPSIDDLGYTADGITTDGGTISGDFGFEDSDGNVLELHTRVRSPDGTESAIPASMLSGVEDSTSGRINFNINLMSLPQGGTWEFDVWIRDADGNDSNELTGTFEVAEGA